MQLFLALLVSGVLLVSLTVLLATGRLSFSQNAPWFLARQSSIWMTGGIVTIAAAAAAVALQR